MKKVLQIIFFTLITPITWAYCDMAEAEQKNICLQYKIGLLGTDCNVLVGNNLRNCQILKKAKQASCDEVESEDTGQCVELEGLFSKQTPCKDSPLCKKIEKTIRLRANENCDSHEDVAACIGIRSAYKLNEWELDEYIQYMMYRQSPPPLDPFQFEGHVESLLSLDLSNWIYGEQDQFYLTSCNNYRERVSLNGSSLINAYYDYVKMVIWHRESNPEQYYQNILKIIVDLNQNLHFAFDLYNTRMKHFQAWEEYNALTRPAENEALSLSRQSAKYQVDLKTAQYRIEKYLKKKENFGKIFTKMWEEHNKAQEEQALRIGPIVNIPKDQKTKVQLILEKMRQKKKKNLKNN